MANPEATADYDYFNGDWETWSPEGRSLVCQKVVLEPIDSGGLDPDLQNARLE